MNHFMQMLRSAAPTLAWQPALLAFLWTGLGVINPAQAQRAETGPLSPSGQKPIGKVLILDNDRTLEGEIEQVGDQYRLRRGDAVSWVPQQTSAVLCVSLEEAYRVLQQRANLKDPDERIRLAQWCMGRGLKVQALSEARSALELRPEYPPSKRMVRHLESQQAAERALANAPKAEPEMTTVLAMELTAPSLGVFNNKIQPILMNACASCHATGRGGDFKLVRTYQGGAASSNRRTTQQNAASVMAQLSPSQPLASPLLVKAVSVHGEQTQPGLRGRQTDPFRMLEDWVRQVSREHMANRLDEPDLMKGVFAARGEVERSRPPLVVQASASPIPSEVRTAEYRQEGGFASAQVGPGKPAEGTPGSPKPGGQPVPSKPDEPDPFDPDIFNGQSAESNAPATPAKPPEVAKPSLPVKSPEAPKSPAKRPA